MFEWRVDRTGGGGYNHNGRKRFYIKMYVIPCFSVFSARIPANPWGSKLLSIRPRYFLCALQRQRGVQCPYRPFLTALRILKKPAVPNALRRNSCPSDVSIKTRIETSWAWLPHLSGSPGPSDVSIKTRIETCRNSTWNHRQHEQS